MTHSGFETKQLNELVEPAILLDANLVIKTEGIYLNSLDKIKIPTWVNLAGQLKVGQHLSTRIKCNDDKTIGLFFPIYPSHKTIYL